MLKISTKGRYGLRAMIELAQAPSGTPVLMADIARAQGLSRKYLHALLVTLRNAGLVYSVRGAGGGYVLARPPEAIRTREVLEALEGELAVNPCRDHGTPCSRSRRCSARRLWMEVNRAVTETLDRFSLADLAGR